MSDTESLVEEIRAFIEKHAKTAAVYDPEFDSPSDRFNGPDPLMFEIAARDIEDGRTPSPVRSTWDSGCYMPYGDVQARAWHDRLRDRVLALTNQPRFGR